MTHSSSLVTFMQLPCEPHGYYLSRHTSPRANLGAAPGDAPNTSHPEIIKRLKRAEGHLKSIITMLEEGRGCLDSLSSTRRCKRPSSTPKRRWCMTTPTTALNTPCAGESRNADDTIREFKEITKYP